MKKIFLYVLLVDFCLLSSLLLAGETGHVQSITKGVKGGLNYSTFKGDGTDILDMMDASYELNYAFGIFVDFPIINQFSIRPEGYYSVKGSEYSMSTEEFYGNANFNLYYLDIPVLLVYKLTRRIGFIFGPSMNIYVNGNVEGAINNENLSENIEDDSVKIPNWALIFGFNYFVKNFHIDLRYNLPLNRWPNDPENDIKISMFQALIGISF